eukprot:TRINITY_DN63805_c0_g1_i1.p1 TRINITY_DN63805_c0_g1~~TRINITY_DN63805_c0_g1_i1.p1  ORF type:complete len:244 (+),score=53.60 TRINITY_DN63805_c0_g1_i1:112-843(+)
MLRSLVGSEMCIRDSPQLQQQGWELQVVGLCHQAHPARELQNAEANFWRFSESLEIKYPGWWATYNAPTGHYSPAGRDAEVFEWRYRGYRIFDNDWRMNLSPAQTSRPPSARPWLGIVQTTTAMWTHKFGLFLNVANCYAAEHGYSYNMDTFEIQTDRFISQGRARSWLKFLRFYQWILHLSADMYIVDRKKSVESLGILNRSHDVVLTLRNWWTGWQDERRLADGTGALPFGMLRQLSLIHI